VNRRISPLGVVGVVICSAVAVVLFLYLSARFGGPTVRFSSPYEVRALLPDSKELAVRSDVLDLGVKVGQVERISLRDGKAAVTFSLEPRYAPIHSDATIRVGEKTLLGEAFIDLTPGRPRTPILRSGATLPPSQVLPASVEIDQALNALDPATIAHVKSTLHTFATGAGSPAASDQVSQTLAYLPRLTDQLRLLFANLHGQEGDIANAVSAARVVLGQLGDRQQQVAEIVSGGRATLQALGQRGQALAAGLHELPLVLGTGRQTLHDAQPLLIDARPLIADLRAAAAPLASALRQLPPVAYDANDLIARLPAFNAAVIPFLAAAEPVLALARAPVVALGPALRNLVAIAQYLSPRANTFAAWFSNTAGLGASGDSKGKFARFSLFIEPGTAFGAPGGAFQKNPYTQPNDALDNKPYSGYPRLHPYSPGSPHR
jgi:phospholipid/cholesterol/gamma-HCH transport system substrate-binding protein